MSGSFTYRSPTTPAGAGWSENLGTDVVRLGLIDGLSTQAQLGSVDGSSIGIDDPDSDVGHDGDGIVGLKQFDWREGDCPLGQRVIWTGYIGQRTYRRGDPDRPSLIVGPNRWIDVGLSDINAFLSFRILVDGGDSGDASFNRPAETDIERVQALLGIYYLSDTLFDGIVAASGGVNMDAVDYTGQKPIDVLNDCAQQSGRNFFVFYDEAGTYTPDAGDFGLFYDFNDKRVFPANNPDFRISNVLTDCDQSSPGVFTGPTWPPLRDGTLTVDPMRVVSATQIQVGKTSVYRQMPTTANKFAWRDQVATAPNLKTVPQAEARAGRYNADQATEDPRLTFTVELPPENVNDAIAGQFFPVRFEHLKVDAVDLASDFVNVRCLRRTVKQTAKTQGFYTVEYECTPMTLLPSGAFDYFIPGELIYSTPILPEVSVPGRKLLLIVSQASRTFASPEPVTPTFGRDPVPTDDPGTEDLEWTELALVTAFNDAEDQYVGFGIYTRDVADGEVTQTPVSVRPRPDDNFHLGAWLWQLPANATFGDVVTYSNGSKSEGDEITFDPLDGFVVGGWSFGVYAFWHRAAVTVTTGTTVESADSSNDGRPPGDPHDGTYAGPGFYGVNPAWTWIATLAEGGSLSASLTSPLDTVTGMGVAGAAIVVTGIRSLPHINYGTETPIWVTT